VLHTVLTFFDLEVKGQGPTKVIMVRDTSPYGHAPTYQISLTYLERQKCYGPDKKILFNLYNMIHIFMHSLLGVVVFSVPRVVKYFSDFSVV
jgi:hypothetical protein